MKVEVQLTPLGLLSLFELNVSNTTEIGMAVIKLTAPSVCELKRTALHIV